MERSTLQIHFIIKLSTLQRKGYFGTGTTTDGNSQSTLRRMVHEMNLQNEILDIASKKGFLVRNNS
jgi:hypothetical protein